MIFPQEEETAQWSVFIKILLITVLDVVQMHCSIDFFEKERFLLATNRYFHVYMMVYTLYILNNNELIYLYTLTIHASKTNNTFLVVPLNVSCFVDRYAFACLRSATVKHMFVA